MLKSNKRQFVYSRFIIWYICSKYYGYTSTLLGYMYGKNHATVLNGVKKISGWVELNQYPACVISEIKRELNLD